MNRFIFVFFFFFLSISFAQQDVASSFALAERCFRDSLYAPALREYQKCITSRQDIPRQTTGKIALSHAEQDDQAVAFYKSAVCFYKLNDYANAVDAFDGFVRQFSPDSRTVDAIFYAAMARKAQANFKEASERFYNAWFKFPASGLAATALFEAASCAQEDGNPERAADLFRSVCEKYPKGEKAKDASLALVKIFLEQHNFADASKTLAGAEKRWAKDNAFLPRNLYYKALLSALTQRPNAAARFYSAMFSQDADFIEQEDAYFHYISFLNGQKDFKTALAVFGRLSEYFQQKGLALSKDFLLFWADVAESAQSFELAEKLYRKSLAALPQDSSASQVLYLLAQCQSHHGAKTDAIETLQLLAGKDSVSEFGKKAPLLAGDLYCGLGLFSNGIAAYRRYLQLPGVRDGDRCLFQIGKIYQEKFKRYGTALQEFVTFLRQYPESPYYNEVMFASAQCEEAEGDVTAALKRLVNLQESNAPKDLKDKAKARAWYLNNFYAKNLTHAVSALAGIAQKDPDSACAADRLITVAGIYENDLREPENALDLYEKAVRYAPQGTDSLTSLLALKKGFIYEKIMEKARFENDTVKADAAKLKAIALYTEVAAGGRRPEYSDDAAFRLMVLAAPGIAVYEKFAATRPQSRHLDEVNFRIGQLYDSKADSGAAEARKKALAAYCRIVSANRSGSFTARCLLACARNFAALGMADSSRVFIKDFFGRFPDSSCAAEAYYIEGLLEKGRQNYSAAMEKFKKVVYSYPFSAFADQARGELARAYFSMGKYEEALSNFRLCVQNAPAGAPRLQVLYQTGRCFAKLGKTDEASDLFTGILKEKPPSGLAGTVYFELAAISESKGAFNDAQGYCQKALAEEGFSDRGAALLKAGSLYFDNRIYPDAARSFERSLSFVRTQAESIDAHTGLISALIMDQKRTEAEKAAAVFKNRFGAGCDAYAKVIYHEGLAYLVGKEYDKARSRFNYILERYPLSEWRDDAAYQNALSYFYSERIDKALDLFNIFIETYPQSVYVGRAFFKLGMICHDRSDFEQAAGFFVKTAQHGRTDRKTRFRASYNSALDYQKLSQWLDAARMYEMILDSFPDEINPSSTYIKLGFCLIQASRYDEALRLLAKAGSNLTLQEKPELLYWTATCYARQGEFQKAAEEFLKVPSLYAGIGRWGLTSECEAARLYERLGDYKKAVALYKKIIRTDGETGELGRNAVARVVQINSITESQ
jgi:tetratricopeptide (TPR) repeat protein